jgi:hypothetical protein
MKHRLSCWSLHEYGLTGTLDMLVKLYDLPEPVAAFGRLRDQNIQIRRSLAPEKYQTALWVRQNFLGELGK